jgi:hypothetical protein
MILSKKILFLKNIIETQDISSLKDSKGHFYIMFVDLK